MQPLGRECPTLPAKVVEEAAVILRGHRSCVIMSPQMLGFTEVRKQEGAAFGTSKAALHPEWVEGGSG
jgi:hypothetical protein